MKRMRSLSIGLLALPLSTACGSNSQQATGTLAVVVQAEDTITAGIAAGVGEEEIHDGWSVGFDKYVAVLGGIEIHLATDKLVEGDAHELYAIDLSQAPAAGFVLWELAELPEGRYEFAYRLSTGSQATRHESVSPADFGRVRDEDLSYLISGALQKPQGFSCPPTVLAQVGGKTPRHTSASGDDCYENPQVSFELAVAAPTSFGPCEIDGLSGVVVSPEKTQTSTITIHGDHLFFNGFPEGSEGGVVRNAQWLADSDLNVDGVVTREELEAIQPSDLPVLDGVQLGGSPLTPLDSMWIYVAAQLKTQGHYQGEGECAVDSIAH